LTVSLPDRAALAARLPLPDSLDDGTPSMPLFCVTSMDEARGALGGKGAALDNWAKAQGFEAKPGQVLVLPDGDGAIVAVLVGCKADSDGLADPGFALGALAGQLPAGTYTLETPIANADMALTAFLLGSYSFTTFKPAKRGEVRLATSDAARESAITQARGVIFGRDLINTPANLLGPAALGDSAIGLADAFGAETSMIVGEISLIPTIRSQ
jgi:leucyl aminopeptidase